MQERTRPDHFAEGAAGATSAESLENPWNLPDWRDPTAYPDPKSTHLHEWRWQFLRRHPRYREDWAGVAGDRDVWRSRAAELAQEYGLKQLIDPRSNLSAAWPPCLDLAHAQALTSLSGAAMSEWRQDAVLPAFSPIKDLMRFVRDARDHDCFLAIIDPGQSLDRQIERIKAEASAWMDEMEMRPTTRARVLQYPRYLRVLDAREAEAYWSTISSTFEAEGLPISSTKDDVRQLYRRAEGTRERFLKPL